MRAKLRANTLDRNKKDWTILDKNHTVLRSKSPLKQSLSSPKQALKGVRVPLSALIKQLGSSLIKWLPNLFYGHISLITLDQ